MIYIKTMPRYSLGVVGATRTDSLGVTSASNYDNPKDAARDVFESFSEATSAITVDESGNVTVFKRDEV